MCEDSDITPPRGEPTDPRILEILREIEYHKCRLVVVTSSSELAMTLESIKDAIARCKEYRLKESLIRELAAEIVDLKVTVRNRSGEDCDAYRMLVLQEKRVAYWLIHVRIVRLLLSKYFWLVIILLFLLWFLFRVKGLA